LGKESLLHFRNMWQKDSIAWATQKESATLAGMPQWQIRNTDAGHSDRICHSVAEML
jgi:hypothetical protein